MYEAHFGLASSPFSMTPDPGALYWAPSHREALAGLTYAVTRRKGFVVLTGAAGTGKTTLLRKLLDSSPVPMRTSFVYNPTLTPAEFLELALADFDMPPGSMSKAQRLLRLERFLLTVHREGKVAVLIVDEAHKLSPELLEEVRLLTNFETAREKLLQIVLAGQPELNGILNREELWQLKQRVAVRLQTQPLAGTEIRPYLQFRWSQAGGSSELPFPDAAVDLIALWSKGIPRMINGICDNALISACAAGRRTVTPQDILEVVGDLDLRFSPADGRAAPLRVAAASGGTVSVSAGNGAKPAPAPVLERVPLERYGEREESWVERWAGRMGVRTSRSGTGQ